MRKKKRKFKPFRFCFVLFLLGILCFGVITFGKWGIQQLFMPHISLSLTHETNDSVYLVYDHQHEQTITKQNTQRSFLPASLAKLFVIDFVASQFDLKETIKANAVVLDKVPEQSSLAEIQAGFTYSLEELYAAMLIPSGNDAAYVLAYGIGEKMDPHFHDPYALFMEKMTKYIQQNYPQTTLHEPSGFDEDANTTVNDLLKVTRHLFQYPWFTSLIQTYQYELSFSDGSSQILTNSNQLLNPDSPYYHPNVHGVKTGTLDQTYNLISYYSINDHSYFIFVLNEHSNEDRYQKTLQFIAEIEEQQ